AEAMTVQNQGDPVPSEMIAAAEAEVQAALRASDQLTVDERSRFLNEWLDSLDSLETKVVVMGEPVRLLRQTIDTVEQELTAMGAPTRSDLTVLANTVPPPL